MTYTGSARSQGAGCNFLRLFIRINAEFGDGAWPPLPAGAPQTSLHYSAPWRAGPRPESGPAQGAARQPAPGRAQQSQNQRCRAPAGLSDIRRCEKFHISTAGPYPGVR